MRSCEPNEAVLFEFMIRVLFTIIIGSQRKYDIYLARVHLQLDYLKDYISYQVQF